jgi:Family of unknown function (DUF6481)
MGDIIGQLPELRDRRLAAETAKTAMLEKFRSALHDPIREEQRAKRLAAHEARLQRKAEREAAKKQAARDAEQAKIRIAAEEAERAAALKAVHIAERDARLAERTAAKKVRRRGY